MNDRGSEDLVASIGELTKMLDGMLDMLNKILDGCEEGRNLTAVQVAELRDHAQLWATQIGRLKKVISKR